MITTSKITAKTPIALFIHETESWDRVMQDKAHDELKEFLADAPQGPAYWDALELLCNRLRGENMFYKLKKARESA